MCAFGERHRIAPRVVQHLVVDSFHPQVEAGAALFRLIVHARFVGIDEVVFAVRIGGEVRHDDVGAGLDGLFPSHRIDGLVGGGSHHVDFRHHQPQDGDHLEGEAHPFLRRGDLVGVLVKRRVGVRDEGSHAHHRHIFVAEEDEVVGEVVEGLEGKSHHHARAGLVAEALQRVDTLQPLVEVVPFVAGMDFVVEFLVRRLDAEEIAVRARLKPLAIHRFALLAQRQGDAEGAAVNLLDLGDEAGDAVGELAVVAFAALDGHRAVTQLMRQPGTPQHLIVGEGVPLHFAVVAAYPTVEARLAADVAQLDQSAQVDFVVKNGQFHG